MRLQKYRKQLSDKAITIEDGKSLFFVPLSFPHVHLEDNIVDVELPEWFIEKNRESLTRIQLLCDLG